MAELKNLIKGTADISCIKAGGIAVYEISAEDSTKYQIEIDMTDTNDVGATALFMAHYDKAIILMRWIRRAIDNGSLLQLA